MGKRRRETWTFQPDDDVVELAKELFGENPDRGERTQFVNEAIRFQYPETALIMAKREVEEAQARFERIKKLFVKIKSINSSEKKAVLSAANATLQRNHEAPQTNAPKALHVQKPPLEKDPQSNP
jgi:hypothetical protein